MSRSLKVHHSCIEKVKLAVKQSGFPNQRTLAEEAGLALATVSNFLTGKSVDYATFVEICDKLRLDWQKIADLSNEVSSQPFSVQSDRASDTLRPKGLPPGGDMEAIAHRRQDWGEAIDVSVFFGRTAELDTLQQWIVEDRCRLVVLLGMGGIGKTALAVRLAERIQGEFEYLIWRSLGNAPPVKDILQELLQFLSNQQETNLPETVDGRILQLMKYLRSHRCLLLLDNAESILRSGDRRGRYRDGYEGYEQLIQCVGETPHQSCLILTSSEKPKGLAAKEGETLPIRSLQLKGLSLAEGRKILQIKGALTGSESEWESVISHYAGNPLALKMVAAGIHELFEGSLSKFIELLQQGTFVFDDIRDLLERQLNRLTNLEKEVMYWLAIHREPVSFQELQEDLVAKAPPQQLLEALASLQRRSLIEKIGNCFTQQPVVMEYIKERLVRQVFVEIAPERAGLLINRSAIKASKLRGFFIIDVEQPEGGDRFDYPQRQ